jgi:hypothetical protein
MSIPLVTHIGNLPVYYRPKLAPDVSATIREIKDILAARSLTQAWDSATRDQRVRRDFSVILDHVRVPGEQPQETILRFLHWGLKILEPLEYVHDEGGSHAFQLVAAGALGNQTAQRLAAGSGNLEELALAIGFMNDEERASALAAVRRELVFGLR